MRISYHEPKRLETLRHRGLDFEEAPIVFAGPHLTALDDRFEYGEDRWITIGQLYENVVVLVWTERDDSCRIISMRKAEIDEEREYYQQLGGPG
jgi:uncharacterized protein